MGHQRLLPFPQREDNQPKNERIFNPFDIPRHAEVIDGRAYVIAGGYNYPNSERFEEARIEALSLPHEGARDIKQTDRNWLIVEIELEEKTEKASFLKNQRGTEFWTYNELQNNDLANKIVNGAGNSDGTQTTGDTDEFSGESTKPIEAPTKFKVKNVDKITNFNPSTDTLGIDTDSFGIDSSATFASGKNKKTVKKLAKQDFDFLYDEKKGGLYFNENGSNKGFGEGGIIAILKGAPDITSDTLEFI